jgi:hypothetical protein
MEEDLVQATEVDKTAVDLLENELSHINTFVNDYYVDEEGNPIKIKKKLTKDDLLYGIKPIKNFKRASFKKRAPFKLHALAILDDSNLDIKII